MNTSPTSIAGIPWYLAEDFAQIKAMMDDGHTLHRTHAEWQLAAEQTEKRLSTQGTRIFRAVLRPAAFRA